MKCRRQTGYLLALCGLLAACGANNPQAGKGNGLVPLNSAQSIQIKRRLAEIAGQANGAAPAEIDSDTRLDGAKAGPGLKLTTMYTLVNSESDGMNSATFAAKLAPVIRKGSCENTDLRPLIDRGVVVVLEYSGSNGKPLASLSIDRATCATLK